MQRLLTTAFERFEQWLLSHAGQGEYDRALRARQIAQCLEYDDYVRRNHRPYEA